MASSRASDAVGKEVARESLMVKEAVKEAQTAEASRVIVAARVRPLNDREKQAGASSIIRCDASTVHLSGEQARTFRVDATYDEQATQQQLFDDLLSPRINDVIAGIDSTVMAYGQTGSGKTHLVQGSLDKEEQFGLAPRASQTIFERLQSLDGSSEVYMSVLEVHRENVIDLLVGTPGAAPQPLEVLDTPDGCICKHLSERRVSTGEEVLEQLRRAQGATVLLQSYPPHQDLCAWLRVAPGRSQAVGVRVTFNGFPSKERRRVAETLMNVASSRSHLVFALIVRRTVTDSGGGQPLHISSTLRLVDLAGSENAKTAGSGTDSLALERRHINESLLALSKVIGALHKGDVFVPYRDSKLTRILKESLGGRCKTTVIVTLSPTAASETESASTLRYAEQARYIRNRPTARVKIACSSGSASGQVKELEALLASHVARKHEAMEKARQAASYERAQHEEEARALEGQLSDAYQMLADEKRLRESECVAAAAVAAAMEELLVKERAAHEETKRELCAARAAADAAAAEAERVRAAAEAAAAAARVAMEAATALAQRERVEAVRAEARRWQERMHATNWGMAQVNQICSTIVRANQTAAAASGVDVFSVAPHHDTHTPLALPHALSQALLLPTSAAAPNAAATLAAPARKVLAEVPAPLSFTDEHQKLPNATETHALGTNHASAEATASQQPLLTEEHLCNQESASQSAATAPKISISKDLPPISEVEPVMEASPAAQVFSRKEASPAAVEPSLKSANDLVLDAPAVHAKEEKIEAPSANAAVESEVSIESAAAPLSSPPPRSPSHSRALLTKGSRGDARPLASHDVNGQQPTPRSVKRKHADDIGDDDADDADKESVARSVGTNVLNTLLNSVGDGVDKSEGRARSCKRGGATPLETESDSQSEAPSEAESGASRPRRRRQRASVAEPMLELPATRRATRSMR